MVSETVLSRRAISARPCLHALPQQPRRFGRACPCLLGPGAERAEGVPPCAGLQRRRLAARRSGGGEDVAPERLRQRQGADNSDCLPRQRMACRYLNRFVSWVWQILLASYNMPSNTRHDC